MLLLTFNMLLKHEKMRRKALQQFFEPRTTGKSHGFFVFGFCYKMLKVCASQALQSGKVAFTD